ncbi:MAG: UDP-N-acetylglucosamine 2-epimerase (non-hydrolyzing), partial [Dehalococcoidales bacterium]|nr:UDP-N-acetylglucosamine 2-epimerase (non-hydrolyzing) [Dehalococcoidales bacterium]
MKVMTILGTRPEIIRLSRLVPKLDSSAEHCLVHTGQNYDRTLKDIFFTDLGVREPDYYLGVKADSLAGQIGKIFIESEKVILKEKPDRVLILGDTNSGLVSLIVSRLGIPVFHMEAGNRCYDDRVPEEINRRVIDHSSQVLMPYTEGSKKNLLKEGIPGNRIFVTGNPIYEVLKFYEDKIESSPILETLELTSGGYFLVTAHRAENVDDEERLRNILTGLNNIQKEHDIPVICSLHPRTRSKMTQFGVSADNDNIRMLEPLGFFDFIKLEQNACCVLSDSGTVQEECCLLKVPNVTIRDTTERPETIECGSNILSGVEPEAVSACIRQALNRSRDWTPPAEYLEEHVSD